MAVKQCSWDGCDSFAAYGTRTKPAWCDEHITEILRRGGLEPLEPFASSTGFRLTRCLACGCEAHYRFVYTLDKNRDQEPTCRACHWAKWTATALRFGAELVGADIVDDEHARLVAESHGYDYLGAAPIPPAYRVRCRYCGRITADRLGDIGWGCSCQVNPRRPASVQGQPEQAFDPVPRLNPELVEQWHPTLNDPLRVTTISPNSKRRVHWRDPVCGHGWVATPADREKRPRLRCPECRTILDSLAWHHPDLAAQWSKDNPLSAWHVRPSGSLTFTPEWVCPKDATHRWRMAATARVQGSTCPMCRESGKSMVELRYFEALRTEFGEAFSGLAVRNPAFKRRTVWVPDVTVHLASGRTLMVEYDGGYWHAAKAGVDLDKSQDLLAAGALVVRLRESPLASLGISSGDYLELTVSPSAPAPERAVAAIREWLVSAGEHTPAP
ncbi:zinc-ribbon domain-containing protein [Xylanimonas ulmi]|uniref:Putative zinc ribbon protein n=1 Tax=Xylanimonas ulmi TaxID=228973 RepID=A0A4Q7LZ42_9MICO|nr:zinc-ribbon domain-containing protein [Xylanibacterium ulmi]RZS60021.1 putative zinc ribbon protein [Xylanibacterium ulmi]